MNPDSRADDIARYAFLVVFANDDLIDAGELAFMERIALADGVVDAAERATLRAIFDRVDAARLAPEVRAEVAAFRARHGI
ncbi:MAG: hypothetical protein RLW61_07160 [Gammaproteobacteria bacterium]